MIEKLKSRFGNALKQAEVSNKDNTIVIERDGALEIFKALRDEPHFSFDMLVDVTAVDWFGREPRFDVVYHLNSLKQGHRLRVKVGATGDPSSVQSLTSLWKSANWLERECFDMFGIRFEGHPDLRRILMYDSFVGHPLRKDYPVNRRQPIVEEVDPVLHPRRPSA